MISQRKKSHATHSSKLFIKRISWPVFILVFGGVTFSVWISIQCLVVLPLVIGGVTD